MITLHEGEKMLLERRRHWLPITLHAIAFIIIASFPFLLMASRGLWPLLSADAIILTGEQAIFLFLSFAWVQVAWTMFFVVWTNYYFDVLILTNRRIIDIEQKSLFDRDVAEISLSNIQDVRVEIKGIIRTLFNFGDLYIQSAGENREFIIKDISNPQGARETITRLRQELRHIAHHSQ